MLCVLEYWINFSRAFLDLIKVQRHKRISMIELFHVTFQALRSCVRYVYFTNPHITPFYRRITSRHGPLNTYNFYVTCHVFMLTFSCSRIAERKTIEIFEKNILIVPSGWVIFMKYSLRKYLTNIDIPLISEFSVTKYVVYNNLYTEYRNCHMCALSSSRIT